MEGDKEHHIFSLYQAKIKYFNIQDLTSILPISC